MRPSRFTREEIVQALERVQAGTPAAEECRKLGITETTFYRWRKEYGTQVPADAREVVTLREENAQLKEIVANLLLDQHQRGAKPPR